MVCARCALWNAAVVDGGVNLETIGRCAKAGAGLFVIGTAPVRASQLPRAFRGVDEDRESSVGVKV